MIIPIFLWLNRNIKVDNRPVFLKHFSEKGVSFIPHIMKENGEIKSWDDLKNEFKLEQRLYFKWMPLVNAIPSVWKNNLKHSNTNSQSLILVDRHLVKSNYLVLKSSVRENFTAL